MSLKAEILNKNMSEIVAELANAKCSDAATEAERFFLAHKLRLARTQLTAIIKALETPAQPVLGLEVKK